MFNRLCKMAILTAAVALLCASLPPAGMSAPNRPRPAVRRPAPAPAAVAAPGRAAGNTVTAAPGNGPLNAAYNSYLNGLRPRVDNQWYLADGNNHVTMTMTVAPDGSVTELEIASSPKNTQAEQAASDAFNKVQPLGALPSGATNIKLTLSFDSNASQHENERHLSARIDGAPAPKGDAATTTQSSSSGSSNNSSSGTESSTSSSSSESK